MKKIILTAALAVMSLVSLQAQEEDSAGATSKGKWLIEANTGFGEASTANTAFSFVSVDDLTIWTVGAEGGYFIADDLALKAGLGYSRRNFDNDFFEESNSRFNWKVGAKYYIDSKFPFQADLNGSSGDGFSPLYLGLQGGYALFIADNVSIEPGVRYGIGLNDEAGDGDFNPLSFNIGFAIYL